MIIGERLHKSLAEIADMTADEVEAWQAHFGLVIGAPYQKEG